MVALLREDWIKDPQLKKWNSVDCTERFKKCNCQDDSNLLENHMLKFGLFNNDVPLPSVDYTTYSLSKNTPSVYHSLHLMN